MNSNTNNDVLHPFLNFIEGILEKERPWFCLLILKFIEESILKETLNTQCGNCDMIVFLESIINEVNSEFKRVKNTTLYLKKFAEKRD